MKFQSSKNLCAFALAVVLAFMSFSCQSAQTSNNNTAANQVAVQKTINPQTPTEAYKMLFEAVKAKDTGKIQQILSKKSLALAAYGAQTYKQPLEKQIANGMQDTTMTDSLPEMRDERIKDSFAAVEVFNHQTNQWDETVFIFEDSGWRLAVGDLFANTYKSPGKGRAQIEREAAEASGKNMIKITPNMNGQIQSNGNVQTGGMPVEPRPKRKDKEK